MSIQSNPYHRRALIAAGCVPLYFAIAVVLFQTEGGGLVANVIAFPALVAMLVWTPVLRPLGLTSGGLIEAPVLPACIGLIVLYAVLVYGLVALVGRWRRGPKGARGRV